jgi:long-chain fatty acid transport protein
LFNILAPGVVEQHLTVGLTKALANGSEFSFAFMYAPNKSVAGMNTFDPTQTLEIEMNQFEIEVAYQF